MKNDEYRTGNTDCKTKYINNGKCFAAKEMAKRNFNIVPDHTRCFGIELPMGCHKYNALITKPDVFLLQEAIVRYQYSNVR